MGDRTQSNRLDQALHDIHSAPRNAAIASGPSVQMVTGGEIDAGSNGYLMLGRNSSEGGCQTAKNDRRGDPEGPRARGARRRRVGCIIAAEMASCARVHEGHRS